MYFNRITLIQMMIRYVFCLIALAIMAGPTPVLALSSDDHTSTQKHFAPMEDWELPSFVAAAPGSSAPAPAPRAAKSHQVFVAAALPKQVPTEEAPKHTAPLVAQHIPSSVPSSSRDHNRPGKQVATESSKPGLAHAVVQAIASTAHAARHEVAEVAQDGLRLARLTAYWAGEGDYYTGRGLSSTGVHLHAGLCAVDPTIIPYGSIVNIPGVGQFLAADTGSAVISRTAAREAGHTLAERSALVIDLFFDHSSAGRAFAANSSKFVPISWWTPSSTSHAAQAARSVFADEDWNKLYSKQL
jgi:3D (Asp-Asp-Asp) domain-containing protein